MYKSIEVRHQKKAITTKHFWEQIEFEIRIPVKQSSLLGALQDYETALQLLDYKDVCRSWRSEGHSFSISKKQRNMLKKLKFVQFSCKILLSLELFS